MITLFQTIVSKFPQRFSLVFAYGSGVFKQSLKSGQQKNMIDFIFVVDDPKTWHETNLRVNRSHYSFLKFGGVNLLDKIQQEHGANVYFNTLVPVENRLIKYGVISTKHLIEDLLDWRTLYISGRMQKPVFFLQKPKTEELKQAVAYNLQSALLAALLCLPEQFSKEELFLRIADLSYSGDFRVYFGEDRNKVKNIVSSQMDHFQTLYENPLKSVIDLHWKSGESVFEQDCSPTAVLHRLNHLPMCMQLNIMLAVNRMGHRDIEEVLQTLAYTSDYGEVVSKAVSNIVWWPALMQSCKGLVTAGLMKSVKYSAKKISKMISSTRKK